MLNHLSVTQKESGALYDKVDNVNAKLAQVMNQQTMLMHALQIKLDMTSQNQTDTTNLQTKIDKVTIQTPTEGSVESAIFDCNDDVISDVTNETQMPWSRNTGLLHDIPEERHITATDETQPGVTQTYVKSETPQIESIERESREQTENRISPQSEPIENDTVNLSNVDVHVNCVATKCDILDEENL